MTSDPPPGSDRQPPDDPIERVRKMFEARAPQSDAPEETTDRDHGSSGNGKLYLGIVIGLILAALLPGMVTFLEVNVVEELDSHDPVAVLDESETVYLAGDDARFMSRIFRESRNEIAYCGLITDDQGEPRLEIWLADMVQASPEQVEFISGRCPRGAHPVLIHTHPNGVLQLSAQDRDTLASESASSMCVQAGTLTSEPGAPVENLACFRETQRDSGETELVRISVRITTMAS